MNEGKLYFLVKLLSALATRFARPTISPSRSSVGSSGGTCRKRSGDLAMRVTESTISDVLAIFDTSSGSIHSTFKIPSFSLFMHNHSTHHFLPRIVQLSKLQYVEELHFGFHPGTVSESLVSHHLDKSTHLQRVNNPWLYQNTCWFAEHGIIIVVEYLTFRTQISNGSCRIALDLHFGTCCQGNQHLQNAHA